MNRASVGIAADLRRDRATSDDMCMVPECCSVPADDFAE